MRSFLVEAVSRHLNGKEDGFYPTDVAGMNLIKMSGLSAPSGLVYKRSLCLTIQGAKEVAFGRAVFDYGEMSYLLITIQMPAISRITCASIERPYLGIVVDLDDGVLRGVMDELRNPPKPSNSNGIGVFSSHVEDDLGDCIFRMVKLMNNQQAIPILQPALMRELCFWLLTGPYAREICKLVLPNSRMRRVAEAITVLRENFARPIRVEQLAAAAQMSPSAFHLHFKSLTSMTPIQYQKQLRLMEARHLMTSESVSVTDAAFQVGYESAAQFSREYRRMFGSSPKRDVTNLKSIDVQGDDNSLCSVTGIASPRG